MIRTLVLAAVCGFAACATLGCKKSSAPGPPAAKSTCRREHTPDELYRLQDRIQKGEIVCPELATPSVEISRDGVSLDGERLSGAVATTSISRFEPLFEKLKLGRELWKQIHPGDEFRPTITITSTRDVGSFAGASVVATAAFAGYPTIDLRSGDLELDFDYPFPPKEPAPTPRPDGLLSGRDPEPQPTPPPVEELRLAERRDNELNVRFVGRTTPRVGLDETLAQSALGALLERECAKSTGRCVDTVVVEVTAAPFHDAIALANAAVKSKPLAGRRMTLAFEAPKAKITTDAPPPRSPSEKHEKARIRIGAVSVKGSLDPVAIASVVRDHEPRFRACYERGLDDNPHLMGRVATTFTIGRDGSVWSPSNSGSDLPDVSTVSCIVRAYLELRFPKPGDSTARVMVPVMFTPD